ncbi:MAG: hypothetical protein ABI665_17850 [Vicinamibacterales bacterium]
MANLPTPAPRPIRPVMDEWGVYDPQQAGLSALFAKLDARHDAPKPIEDSLKSANVIPTPERPSLRDAK